MDPSLNEILEKNEQEFQRLPEKPTPITQNLPQGDVAVYEKTKYVPVVDAINTNVPWFQIKAEYLADSSTSPSQLAKKYNLNFDEVMDHFRKEHWHEERKSLYSQADALAKQKILEDLVAVKLRHIQDARDIQKKAMKNIKKIEALNAKDALAFWDVAMRAERETLGLNKKDPKIVNIITQQQQIINRYKRKDGDIIEAVTAGESTQTAEIKPENQG